MPASSSQVVLSAADFINSIGVNTPVGASTSYNNAALLTDALSYLGVTNLRVALTSDAVAAPVEAALAMEGYKLDVVVAPSVAAAGSSGIASFVQALDAFQSAHPGSIVAVEGLNEEDIQPFSYNGSSTVQAAAAFQGALYGAIKADAALSGVSVYNFTISDYNNAALSASVSDGASTDYANAHAYVGTYTTPQAGLASSLALAETMTGGTAPTVITETGYSTLAGSSALGVDETVQAKSILDTLLDAYKDGVSTTYLYQLLDNNSLSSSDQEAHFGLFNADGTPKLAATAIHNLTSILADNGTGGAAAGTAFNYALKGLPSSGSSMVLAKSGGVYDLVVWAEPTMWDATTGQEVTNAASTVSVDLGSVYTSVKVYDPLVGTAPIATYANAETLSIAVTDHPLIIEVSNAAGIETSAAVTASTSVSGTAASIVAQMSSLNANTALTSITLSDTHVLSVASTATMDYMIQNYQHALSAIQGGYSFSVTNQDTNWTKTVIYDKTGTQLSSTESAYSGGVITSSLITDASGRTDAISYTSGVETGEIITNADGSKAVYAYNITGQSYTSAEADYNAAGTMTAYVLRYANGTMEMNEQFLSSGAKLIAYFNTAGVQTIDQLIGSDGSVATGVYTSGVKSAEYISNADGSLDNYFYNIQGQAFVSEHLHVNAAGAVTGTYLYDANNTLISSKVVGQDGSVSVMTVGSTGTDTSLYSASGALLSDVLVGSNGSYTTTLYTAGVKSKIFATNADQTQDNYFYNITGQGYTSEHDHITASGVTDLVQRYFANGHLAYKAVVNGDGSRVVDTFGATGVKLSEITQTSSATTTDQFDANGLLTSEVIKGTDGSYTTSLYTAGVKTKMYVLNADQTQDNYFYNVTGQSYASEHDHLNASGVTDLVQRYAANGQLAYTSVVNGDGSRVTDTYAANGARASEITVTASATTTDQFDGNGLLTSEVVKGTNGSYSTSLYTAGVKTRMYVVNADKTQDNYFYNITGQSYTSEHDHINASGVTDTVTRIASDGSMKVSAYASGLTLSGGAGNDTFTSAGGETFGFSGNFGKDTIQNFSGGSGSNHDVLQLSKTVASAMNQLSIAQNGSATVITAGSHGSITLMNTAASSLGAANFAFV